MMRNSGREHWLAGVILTLALVLGWSLAPALAENRRPAAPKPRVEVVFCLDTTGSMGGLIEGAKQKIWSISNQIASGKPVPELHIGLVAYRDRGDNYVTKVFGLTDDLDAIHGHLNSLHAGGGGDEPESVNQALHEAVAKIKWSTGSKTLRLIFLVGDAPPHMDYKDDIKYTETCRQAAERGIIINTVQCGGHASTRTVWQDISKRAEGSYVQIAQDGGVVAIATPYDKRLAEINQELTRTVLCYGCAEDKATSEAKKTAAMKLAVPAAADRVSFASKDGRAATYDLLDGIQAGKVQLEKLKNDELPVELQKMTLAEQKEHLRKLDIRRTELKKEAKELDAKRSGYVSRKLKANLGKSKDGFDNQVLSILRVQAKKCELEY